jgi:thioredoxin 1
MPSPNMKDFTVENFDAEVMKSGQPVLVNFFAEWNGMSRELAPTIETLADAYAGRAKVGRVDTDANRELSKQHDIVRLPTTLIIREGKVVNRLLGLQPEAGLRVALEAALAGG